MRRVAAVCSRIAPLVGLALASAGCGLLDNLAEPTSLTIQKFEASPEVVDPGGESVLTWSVAGADLVEIDHGVGPVRGDGTIRVRPEVSTTYTLVAVAGASQATASIRLVVEGAGADPTPTPTPDPSPTPTPSPSPTPAACGGPTAAPSGCSLLVTSYGTLPEGQCLQLNEVAVDGACPVSDGTARVLSFTVTAATSHSFLRWRQAQGNGDALLPSEGFVAGGDTTTVLLNDTVRGPSVEIELLDPANNLMLRFELFHR